MSMLSTGLELLGLAALAAGVFVLAGLGWALIAVGACLLFVGYSAEGVQPLQALKAKAASLRLARAKRKAVPA
jgi:hypothetical protein